MFGCGGCGIPRPHPGPLHAAGQKGGSVGQSRPSASRRLRWASRAIRASPICGAMRVSHTSGAPSSAGESGAGSGGVTREFAGGAAAGGSGAGFGRVTGESSAEAAAHPNAGCGGSVHPGKRCPSMARRTVSTRSACVILAARAAGPACAAAASAAVLLALDAELVGAFDAVEREGEAAEVLRRHRLLARAELGHGAERQRSQGLDRDEGAKPLGAGVAVRVPIPRQSDRSRAAGQIRPSTRSASAALVGSRTRAASCARDQIRIGRCPAHGPALDDLVHGGAVLDRCGHGVLDCGRQQLVRCASAHRICRAPRRSRTASRGYARGKMIDPSRNPGAGGARRAPHHGPASRGPESPAPAARELERSRAR